MPWSDNSVEEQRLRIIELHRSGVSSVAALCRAAGISRECFYKWSRRYEEGGRAGLLDLSRAPLESANAVSEEVAGRLISLRQAHPTWGARKLVWRLQRDGLGLSLPSASTAHEIIRRAGLVKPRHRHRRAKPLASSEQPQGPGDIFCADFKGEFRLGNGELCYPLTMQDMYSRQLLVCRGLPRVCGQLVRGHMIRVFEEHGLPRVFKTDNGPPFGAAHGRLSPLSVWLALQGVELRRIQPGRPQQNGRLERLHRTLKEETARPPAGTRWSQQKRFDEFRSEYNGERPHEALGGHVPQEVHQRSRRAYTGRLQEPQYPGHFEVVRVNCKGYASWKGKRRYVGEPLAGHPIGLVEVREGIWCARFSHVEIARYDERHDHWELLSLY
jgi:transposase InsO family protein